MSEYSVMGKLLLFFGIILVILGGIFLLNGKYPFLSKMPGNIIIHTKNITIFFPLGFCILVSIVLSFVIRIFNR